MLIHNLAPLVTGQKISYLVNSGFCSQPPLRISSSWSGKRKAKKKPEAGGWPTWPRIPRSVVSMSASDHVHLHVPPHAAILLFQQSCLRCDDHPALAAAAGFKNLAPVFVLDPALEARGSSPASYRVLSAALTSLRAQLRSMGSDLIVRTGPYRAVVAELATELGGTAEAPIFLLSESEGPTGEVSSLSLIQPEWLPQATCWDASRFNKNYRAWTSSRGMRSAPLPPPRSLPPLPPGIEPGIIPTPAELRLLLDSVALRPAPLRELLALVNQSTESSPEAVLLASLAASSPDPLDLLRAYLSPASVADSDGAQGSGSSSDSLRQQVNEAVAAFKLPSAPGAEFHALISPWMELGALSRRRVLEEASREGVLPARAAAAIRATELSEFHALLSSEGTDADGAGEASGSGRHAGAPVEFRWRGMRLEYVMEEPRQLRPEEPAVLLVHGFGAFGSQWRGNMAALAAAGYRVFAPTLPGFGRSEKAAVPYSQDLWRDFLRDFTLQVVGQPVVLVGNSIGGFISCCLAADYPQMVAGLVLLNSAGPVDPAFDIEAWDRARVAKKPPPRLLVEAISRALFWYLELNIKGTLRWLYPTNPGRADQWLADEIYRAACDLGSLEVFQCAFYLPPPRALNYLVGRFGGPTRVLQGVLDPLNDARGRAEDLRACSGDNLDVVMLQAGHCPHDEQPELVNQELLRFLKDRVAVAFKGTTAVMELPK